MRTSFQNRFLLGSAVVLGLGVSTGHPAGIVAAAAMPLACLITGTRKAAFENALGYYVAALWPMVPGLSRYLGQSATVLLPVALWIVAAALLAAPWAIAWTPDRLQCLWRAPLALLAAVIPPLGVIGVTSPLTAAGYLFPGTASAGLAAAALLPGVLLSTLRRRYIVLYLTVALAIGGRVFRSGNVEPPRGWIAVSTHFGDVSQPFGDFRAAQFMQRRSQPPQ